MSQYPIAITQFPKISQYPNMPTPHTVHRTLCTARPTPCTVHRTPYTVHHSPYTKYRAPHNVHRTPHTVHRAPHTVHRIPCTARRTPHTVHRTGAPAPVKKDRALHSLLSLLGNSCMYVYMHYTQNNKKRKGRPPPSKKIAPSILFSPF